MSTFSFFSQKSSVDGDFCFVLISCKLFWRTSRNPSTVSTYDSDAREPTDILSWPPVPIYSSSSSSLKSHFSARFTLSGACEASVTLRAASSKVLECLKVFWADPSARLFRAAMPIYWYWSSRVAPKELATTQWQSMHFFCAWSSVSWMLVLPQRSH